MKILNLVLRIETEAQVVGYNRGRKIERTLSPVKGEDDHEKERIRTGADPDSSALPGRLRERGSGARMRWWMCRTRRRMRHRNLVRRRLMAQTIINSGMPLQHESWKMAREGGMMYIERWPQGSFSAVTRIGSARDAVITPQHTGHDLDAESYFIDEEFLCWLEWPGIPDAQDENWYVYLQKRDGSAPQLLDEGPYSTSAGVCAETG